MQVYSVLLADDDKSVRAIAEMVLSTEFDVYLAESGADCLIAAECERPDIILLDDNMPGMDGREALTKLRKNPLTAAIPVILMSADVQTDETKYYRMIGTIGLVLKPFDPFRLGSQIRKLAAPY